MKPGWDAGRSSPPTTTRLTELEASLPRVRNLRMDVLEEGDRVVVPASGGSRGSGPQLRDPRRTAGGRSRAGGSAGEGDPAAAGSTGAKRAGPGGGRRSTPSEARMSRP